jgi:hypothetical protein
MTTSILQSIIDYETWLRTGLGSDVVEADLAKKHDKMKSGSFTFLRATYWRWAETILDICPELRSAPVVLAIGDTHLENFGTWRDVEGRLVWGANDFDDAAPMPYALDLVRLAVSASLARTDEAPSVREISEAILRGYRGGLSKSEPIILDRDHKRLRETLVLSNAERQDFWDRIEHLDHEPLGSQPKFELALRNALPQPGDEFKFARRSAGTGSLGRPRFVTCAKWRGGPVLREAKSLVMSAWSLRHKRDDPTIYADVIANGRARSPDPHYNVSDHILVRRLSPNSRKIEVKDDPATLLSMEMLELMGFEIANCHADDAATVASICNDLDRRGSEWLRDGAKKAAASVAAEQKEYSRTSS